MGNAITLSSLVVATGGDSDDNHCHSSWLLEVVPTMMVVAGVVLVKAAVIITGDGDSLLVGISGL